MPLRVWIRDEVPFSSALMLRRRCAHRLLSVVIRQLTYDPAIGKSIGNLNRVFYPRPIWEFGEERDGRLDSGPQDTLFRRARAFFGRTEYDGAKDRQALKIVEPGLGIGDRSGHRRRLGRKTELGKHPKSIQLALVQ